MEYDHLSVEAIKATRGYRKNIKGDKFSLYISNYPSNAQYLKSRIGNPEYTLAELCCSIGITLEYLAPGFKKLIGVDIDKTILHTCQTNLNEAGWEKKVELIQGDVFDDQLLKTIQANIVIYDIPFWYSHRQEGKGDLIKKNPPLLPLIEKIRKYITSEIIIFSPPEWDMDYFRNLLGPLEFEQVYINHQHNRNQIYLGNLAKTDGKTIIELDN